jgi:Flp pilus assembly protein TadG
MRRLVQKLCRSERGAVAPTIALSLTGLIAIGGLAFDYARLANLDTELQDAADQAALAAASQLDQKSGSIQRATAAAQSLLTNRTLMANDANASGTAVTIPTVVFYPTKADAENDTNGFTTVTNFANANFVRVVVAARRARYALTPIVGAFTSGDISAEAVAGLGSAICKVPPVMICNPAEPDTNTNVDLAFDANALAGHGLRLISVGNGNTAWAPGNFGYLDTGSSTSNPNVELRQALGWVTAPGDCSGLSGVQTRTGAGTPVTQALNTRFDIYEKPNTGNGNSASCPTGSSCPPSINTVKDVLRRGNAGGGNKCGFANNEWELPTNQYLPADTAGLTQTQAAAVDAMGYPRDMCHALSINGSCTYNGVTPAKIGNGAWDRNAYFKVNYGWSDTAWPNYINSGINPISTSTPSRYQVYLWEIANRETTIGGKTILDPLGRQVGGTTPSTPRAYGQPVCSPLQSPATGGVVPGGTNVDRRRISAAVLNCHAYDVHGGGGTVYPVLKWIEFFLVEPSLQRPRTDANDVYVEIIGETSLGAGATGGQVVRRDTPYLIK